MRVAVVLEQVLGPVPGGTGRYAAELTAGLLRTAAPGDDVHGWVAWHRDVSAARSVVDVSRLPLGRRALAAVWTRAVGPVPGGDLVHAPTPLMPPRRSTPVIVTVHDAVPWTHPETLTPHGARWHRRMVDLAVRHADAITVPTSVVASELREVFPTLSADRLHVLGAGVARALLTLPDDRRAADTRARLRLPDEYLVTVATLEPRKGLDVLIEALASGAPSTPPLVVVGQPGWGDVDVQTVARRAGLPAGRLHAVGRIDDDDLNVVLRGARALVAPSRAEGFGLPLAEAMAVGVPVVCSDIPVFAETAGSAALAVPVGDSGALAQAIEAVTTDGTLRAGLIDAGLSRAREHDWDAVARRAWSLYGTVRGSGGESARG